MIEIIEQKDGTFAIGIKRHKHAHGNSVIYNLERKLGTSHSEFKGIFKNKFNGFENYFINNYTSIVTFIDRLDAERALEWVESIIVINKLEGISV